MATLTLDGLKSHLLSLSHKEPAPALTEDVLVNPIDVYRCYLSEIFCRLLTCDAAKTWDAIQWPNFLSNGDLSLVVPRLRIQGVDPVQLAGELSEKVGQHTRIGFCNPSI